jgi:hypothetical protein
MSKFIKMVTPAGVAVWPALGKANTKFNPEGVFEIKLRMDRNDPKVVEFAQKIDEAREVAMTTIRAEYEEKAKGAGKAAAMAALKKMSMADSPIKPVYDDEGNETNDVTIQAKLKAVFTRKDGTTGTHQFVPCVDAKKNAVDPREVSISGGSICKASITVYPYVVPSSMQVGVAVRLEAVQVIKLVSYGSASGADAFGEEEGEVIAAPTAAAPAPAAVQESEDPSDF